MKTDINTGLIKELLDESTLQLTPVTLEKLRNSRSRALAHQRTHSRVPVLAWLGHHGGQHDSFHMSKSMSWAVAALFVACLVSGATFWQNYTSEHEICDVDIAILTDDLPIHVYLD
jgi:Protein of unknown function (DUF3619)